MDSNKELSDFDRIKRQVLIFNEIGKTLTSSLTINEVLEKILGKVAEFFNPENWSLLLLDEEKNELYFEIVVGEASEKIKDLRLKIGEGVAGWVAETGKPLIVPNTRNEPLFTKKIDERSEFSTESIICIPMRIRNRVIGVIELINKKGLSPFHQYDIEVLSTVADYAAIALENARNYEQIQKMTITDDLSELYNSRHLHKVLEDEIAQSQKNNSKLSIIFFDLDSFKLVNDTHGHLVGSSLLGRIGNLLADTLEEGRSAARYGGDEFVVILPNTSKEDAVVICEKLKQRLTSEKFLADKGLDIQITASFGISTFPDDAKTKDEILHLADDRMYYIKDHNKNDISSS